MEETSILLLALAHATWAGQAFAHRTLKARPLIPFHFTLDQNTKRGSFKSEDLGQRPIRSMSSQAEPIKFLYVAHQSRLSGTLCACDFRTGEVRNGK